MEEYNIQENIMKFWNQYDIQKRSIAQNKSYPKVTIYDGPPFPTGPPHHGHMMTSTVKDTVTRYLMATGHYVPRQLGWDMHGPNNPSVDEMEQHILTWENALSYLGRWDGGKTNTYRTSDPEYVQSVWWVFKTLWNKGHLRLGYGLTPHCPGCNVFYSDFERYQQQCTVTEQTVYYKIPIRTLTTQCPFTHLLVWEMWPWTLIDLTCYAIGSNDSEYVVDDNGILMSKHHAINHDITYEHLNLPIPLLEAINPLTGEYVPVVRSCFVEASKGTGITRIAPNMDTRSRIIMSLDTPPDGRQIPKLRSSEEIINILRNEGYLVSIKEITHNDSACPKCSERLITYPYHGIFYNISDNRNSIRQTLEKIYWEPKSSKERILQYLSVAQDWLITRDRGPSDKGIAVPMWVCDNRPPLIIGSYAELETKDWQGRQQIGYRFDSWFDSACMPYASVGYPFKTTKMELINSLFPCLLAIEGVDQVYGWFFTTNVISNALFEGPAFRNIITNGLVLETESGRKMSKSKIAKHSEDPVDVIKTHGADTYRVYLMKNRLLSGIDFKYDRAMINNHFTRALHSVYNQILKYTNLDGAVNINFRPTRITNITDNWILQALDDYLTHYHQLMRVFKVARALSLSTNFLNHSIKKYIYFNRARLGGLETISRSVIIRVFYYYLLTVAPFIPFNTEYLYRQLQNYSWISRDPVSIHLCQIPERQWRVNKQFLRSSDLMFQVIDLVNRTPTESKRIRVYLDDVTLIRGVDSYISEITGKDIIYCNNLNNVLLGQVEVRHHKVFSEADVLRLQNMTLEQIIQLDNDGFYRKQDGDCTYPGQYVISYRPKQPKAHCYCGPGVLVKVEPDGPSPSQSLVDSKEVIIKGQIIGRQLDRQIKKSGRCIVYIEHPSLSEISDERAKVLVSNINRYTLPIIGQSIYQYRGRGGSGGSGGCGTPFCTVNMTVFSCPITFHLLPIDEECTET